MGPMIRDEEGIQPSVRMHGLSWKLSWSLPPVQYQTGSCFITLLTETHHQETHWISDPVISCPS